VRVLLRHADRFADAVRTVVEAPAARWWWEPLDGSTVTSVLRWHTDGTAWFHPAFTTPVRLRDWHGPVPYPG
jgi:hypothetical protein